MSERWSGDRVRAARARIEARGWPQPCCRCGKPVMPHDRWQADHYPISRAQAIFMGIPLDNLPVAAAHGSCNERAGGQHGARITNARKNKREHRAGRRAARLDARARGIRGI